MGFFDYRLPPEPGRRDQQPREQIDAMMPGVAAVEALVGRSDRAAVAAGGIRAYPTGFELTVTVLTRDEQRHARPFHHFDHEDPGAFLRFGVVFADGGSTSNLEQWHGQEPEDESASPTIRTNGGGGSGRRLDMRYWVSPLPPPGPLTLLCEWPAYGIPESRFEIDSQPIRDAAARATPLFADGEPAADAGLLLVAVVAMTPGGIEAGTAYEDRVLKLLGRHAGVLEQRLRAVDGTEEVHVIRFADRAGYEAYLKDPDRLHHRELAGEAAPAARVLEVTRVR